MASLLRLLIREGIASRHVGLPSMRLADALQPLRLPGCHKGRLVA